MKIELLPDNIVNQIAAGEVIERPASVVKELIENSIDAGATRIEVSIKNGGASLVSVSDNGSGMSKEDLAMSIKRHATSKMSKKDLFNINTFGFRGEALASISSVARVSIKSKEKDSSEAWELTVEGGNNAQIKPTAINAGTKIEIRDLFYSTPARLKFLKADSTETRYVRDTIEKIAMANPSISFYLFNNDKKSLAFEATDLKSRIASVLGKDFYDKSIEVKTKVNDVAISGYIGVPSFNKSNSMSEYIFVNGRPIRDKLVLGAITAGYMDVLERGRYPALALFIDVPPTEVDVNVHPAKSEVRFKDSRVVRSAIVHTIREAIANNSGENTQSILGIEKIFSTEKPSYKSSYSPSYKNPTFSASKNSFKETEFLNHAFTAPSVKAEVVEEVKDENQYPLGSAKAQLHKNYIVSQTEDAIFIIDQHAAHERIVYEKIKEKLNDGGIEAQNLLIPEIIELKASNIEAILFASEELYKLGLEIESFGEDAVVVRSLPVLLKNKVNIKQLVIDLSDDLLNMDKTDILQSKLYEVCATIACHGSVRSGRILSIHEMNELLRQMENCKNIQQCNHGRPTYVELSLKDIEKLFNR